MGKHLVTKPHIAKLNELTESKVTELSSSIVDEICLVIVKRQESRGITIVSLQSQIIFDIQVTPYWPKWQAKRSKLAGKEFRTCEFHQDMWNRYLMLGFVAAHIPWNPISTLELRWSYQAVRDNIVLPSAKTLSNISRRNMHGPSMRLSSSCHHEI